MTQASGAPLQVFDLFSLSAGMHYNHGDTVLGRLDLRHEWAKRPFLLDSETDHLTLKTVVDLDLFIKPKPTIASFGLGVIYTRNLDKFSEPYGMLSEVITEQTKVKELYVMAKLGLSTPLRASFANLNFVAGGYINQLKVLLTPRLNREDFLLLTGGELNLFVDRNPEASFATRISMRYFHARQNINLKTGAPLKEMNLLSADVFVAFRATNLCKIGFSAAYLRQDFYYKDTMIEHGNIRIAVLIIFNLAQN